MKKKITAIIAIMMCVFTLGLSVSPAFAASPASATATVSWSSFPTQARYSGNYTASYTYGIQVFLYYLYPGYRDTLGTLDGIYGSGTEKMVKQFQSGHNLTKTGETDSATWAKMQSLLVKLSLDDYPNTGEEDPNIVHYGVGTYRTTVFKYNISTGKWSVFVPSDNYGWKIMN